MHKHTLILSSESVKQVNVNSSLVSVEIDTERNGWSYTVSKLIYAACSLAGQSMLAASIVAIIVEVDPSAAYAELGKLIKQKGVIEDAM